MPVSALATRSYSDFIETNEPSPDLTLSITTSACYHSNTALDFADKIGEKFGLYGEKMSDIATCLQEAVMNAILHGNLQVGSKFDNLRDFEERGEEITARLEMDEYAQKRINIRAWDGHNHLKLAVSDEGEGFLLENAMAYNDKTSHKNPHGRGLLFIKAMAEKMWLGEDKRTLYMTFSC